MKPADGLGPQPGEVVVPIGQQPQHRGVVHRGDLTQPAMAQGDNRRGPGIVRVGLVGTTRVEQADASRQRRRHINHRLADGDELLGEQRTQPGRRLDGPSTRREVGREAKQPLPLPPVNHDTQLADDALAAIEYRCGV
jgi:hypothetical protein